jgi:hypothetical protein
VEKKEREREGRAEKGEGERREKVGEKRARFYSSLRKGEGGERESGRGREGGREREIH